MAVCRSQEQDERESESEGVPSATNYTCGDDYGWQRPPASDPSYFTEWSANYTFYFEDMISFDSKGADINVVLLSTAAAYAACNTSDPTGEYTSSTPTLYSFLGVGDYYFAMRGRAEGEDHHLARFRFRWKAPAFLSSPNSYLVASAKCEEPTSCRIDLAPRVAHAPGQLGSF